MIILGGGMAGCLAGLMSGEATIYEAGNEVGKHQALLRFRSDQISNHTGIPFTKVSVMKAIWSDGQFHQPNPRLINLYSCKVTGAPQQRSIANIEPDTRWIAPDNFHQLMVNQLGARIRFGSPVHSLDQLKGLGPIISTLPLYTTLKMVGIELETKLTWENIHVTKYKIPGANVYQTVYFPDRHISVYRASITKDILIIESMGAPGVNEKTEVVHAFGLDKIPFEKLSDSVQKLGKIIPLPDQVRKDLLYHLSTKHNIFSLGRYACWRNVMMDDVFDDILKIKRLMNFSNYDIAKDMVK